MKKIQSADGLAARRKTVQFSTILKIVFSLFLVTFLLPGIAMGQEKARTLTDPKAGKKETSVVTETKQSEVRKAPRFENTATDQEKGRASLQPPRYPLVYKPQDTLWFPNLYGFYYHKFPVPLRDSYSENPGTTNRKYISRSGE